MLRIFQVLLLAFSVQVSLAAPVELVKRATTTDTADIGFAIGTTGGAGGTTVTVTSLAALTSSVAGNAKKTVIVSGEPGFSKVAVRLELTDMLGQITGNTVVNVGSNTSVLGKAGSGASLQPPAASRSLNFS